MAESKYGDPQSNWTFERLLANFDFIQTPEHFLVAEAGSLIKQDVSGIYGHSVVSVSERLIYPEIVKKCTQGTAQVLSRGDMKIKVPKILFGGNIHSPKHEKATIVEGGVFTVIKDLSGHTLAFLDPKQS